LTDTPDQYAVVGYPVAHSKSPFIHELFARQTGQFMEYSRLELSPEQFESGVRRFFASGGKGLNITVPHKQSAWQMCDWRAPDAERAGAVNTLYLLPDGRLAGDNTDGTGLIRDIEKNHGGQLSAARVLILGAGGAVRGLLPRLIAAQPAAIFVVNRNLARAEALAADFSDQFAITILDYAQLSAAADSMMADWIINGSSAGLQGDMPDLPSTLINQRSACYDMVYAAGGTAFQAWARHHGAALALDGSGMLVEQAAESFRIWRGVAPDTAPVLTALHELLLR
jgi:shikimate dehydrogenase